MKEKNFSQIPDGVDFSYTFAFPHRITLSRPQASHKTLVDLHENRLVISWTYHSLLEKIPNTWDAPKIDWIAEIFATVNGMRFEHLAGKRHDDGAPGFTAAGNIDEIAIRISGIATKAGDVFKIVFENDSDESARCSLSAEHKNGWVISNPAWIDGEKANTLTAMEYERPDRLLLLATGADNYPIMAKTITMEFFLPAKGKKTGWLIRPYESYLSDSEKLENTDWENECDFANQEWQELLAKSMRIELPDKSVEKAFMSCLADVFVMREPLKDGYIGVLNGTEVYRSTGSFEPMIATMLFDQLGYNYEAARELPVHLDAQGDDGNWNDPQGWGHHMWGATGYKSWAIMEHYRLTRNIDFLISVYPQMKKSSLWQNEMRKKTMADRQSPYYGLMPRGMGDGGLFDGDDYFGIFYPHNCFAVFADKMAMEAAEILNEKQDFAILKNIYEQARNNLLESLRNGAITEIDHSWIPGTANKKTGSCWGSLSAFYPCDFLDCEDPLLAGTLRHIEGHVSKGGLPLGTGWMKDGCWVAIALDNVSETYLALEDGDSASKYLYPVLNHGSVFHTWCEERGELPMTKEISGDLQHLWTPLAVCRYIRDALVFDHSVMLHLALGIPREWLAKGCKVGIENAHTRHGNLSYSILRDEGDRINVRLHCDESFIGTKISIHLRIPETDKNMQIVSSTGGNAVLLTDKSGRPGKIELAVKQTDYLAVLVIGDGVPV